MSKNRKKYDEEFKKRAVRMSYSSERPVTAVAESLGITSNMIYRWWQKYTPDGEKMQLAQQQDELSDLRSDTRREKVISMFNEGQGVYGVNRVCGILRRDGDSASYPVVKRIMAQEGLNLAIAQAQTAFFDRQ